MAANSMKNPDTWMPRFSFHSFFISANKKKSRFTDYFIILYLLFRYKLFSPFAGCKRNNKGIVVVKNVLIVSDAKVNKNSFGIK